MSTKRKAWMNAFKRSECACHICSDNESTVQLYYRGKTGNEICDVAESKLRVICDDCLLEETERRPPNEQALLHELGEHFSAQDINQLAGAFAYVNHFNTLQHMPDVVMSALSWAIETPEIQKRIVDDYFVWLKETRNQTLK